MRRVSQTITRIFQNRDSKAARFFRYLRDIFLIILGNIPFYGFFKLSFLYLWKDHRKVFLTGVVVIFVGGSSLLAYLIAELAYIYFDDDPNRGAMAFSEDSYDDQAYSLPTYLHQGWNERDSLYFYNTSIGSNILPYGFFLFLEKPDSQNLFCSHKNLDQYRFLPQKPTFSNPDGLPVGIAKDTFSGKDYVGITCAACHTAQLNYNGQAIRVDGGPALIDLKQFMVDLSGALEVTLNDPDKRSRFVHNVIKGNGDFDTEDEVVGVLEKYVDIFNKRLFFQHSSVSRGMGRIDFFGNALNEIAINTLSKKSLIEALVSAGPYNGESLVTSAQAHDVTEGLNQTAISEAGLALVFKRLQSTEPGYPGLDLSELGYIKHEITWEANAPVNYPHLWQTHHSNFDYWTGAISNSKRDQNTHKILSLLNAYGSIVWRVEDSGFSLSSVISGQSRRRSVISMHSSADKVAIDRLQTHLESLKTPQWPEEILGDIDSQKARRGKKLYGKHCRECHEINQDNSHDLVNTYFVGVNEIGTDPNAAYTVALRKSPSGNFEDTWQSTEVGRILIGENINSIILAKSILPAVWATPDPDKGFIQANIDRVRSYFTWLFSQDYSGHLSVRNGSYSPSDTANPVRSLLSYRAKPLNGVWATAPYLHNGSVPTLYDLLLPKKKEGDPVDREYRPDQFMVGSREFDPDKVGFKTRGYDGFRFVTSVDGNFNSGHEYGTGLTKEQKLDLIEYLKTL